MSILSINGTSRIIDLDNSTSDSIRQVYSGYIDWVASSDNAKYLDAFDTIADPPTVPVYATLKNGWKIRLQSGAYTKKLTDGFLYDSAGGDPIAPVESGIEPRVVYENPVLAVGFETGSGLSSEQDARLKRLEQAHYNRRTRDEATGDEVIYDDDKVTEVQRFNTTKGTNSITEIDPV